MQQALQVGERCAGQLTYFLKTLQLRTPNISYFISRQTSHPSHLSERITPWIPDQCTINIYQPGQGIAHHVDTHRCIFSSFDFLHIFVILTRAPCSAFESVLLSVSAGRCVHTPASAHPCQRPRSLSANLPVLLAHRALASFCFDCLYASATL